MSRGLLSSNREKGFLKEALGKATAEAQAKTTEVDRQRGEVKFCFLRNLFTPTSSLRQLYRVFPVCTPGIIYCGAYAQLGIGRRFNSE